MQKNIIRIDRHNIDTDALSKAVALLRAGELVAFPTETVYGLGALALEPHAVQRIFAAKGRPSYNPLIVHVADIASAQPLVAFWPDYALRLAEAFWPGPLTLVLPKRTEVPDCVTAGRNSVGVRVPNHPVALALLRSLGAPVAAPSANRFTELSPTTAEHVAQGLGDRVPLIVDAGPCDVGVESTVVDCTGPQPVLLRPGMLELTRLEAVAGSFAARGADDEVGDTPRLSPGMIERHYAPRGKVEVVDSQQVAKAVATGGGPVGVLVWSAEGPIPGDYAMRLPSDPDGLARELYAALHRCDELGCVRIVIERLPSGERWHALNDRLRRASFH